MANSPQDNIAKAEFGAVSPGNTPGDGDASRNLEMLYDIPLRIDAELGRTAMTVRDFLELGPGAVVELDRMAGEAIDLLVNGVLIGRGDVVVVNENFGLRITEIIGVKERLKEIAG